MQKYALKKIIVIGIILITVVIGVYAKIASRSGMVPSQSKTTSTSATIPKFLRESFPKTDWLKSNPVIVNVLNGGPGKDGIPAIDAPKFVSINNFKHSNDVLTIVLQDDNSVKVYPYNILVWHEIVNDVVDNVPVSITFCPLCGSAVVYERKLQGGISTFGVSGFLLESNMIMYDRLSETLWQQSTGKALAGKYFGQELQRVSFQLLTIGEVRTKYKDASVLSEDTGYNRNYDRNPYSRYDEKEDFIFSPSLNDSSYPSKTIFVAFKVEDIPVAIPWLVIQEGKTYQTKINNQIISFRKENKDLVITDDKNRIIPFYFEMWFSWAVQHQNKRIVFDPNKINNK